jgi:5,6,7,8-tetrahydromethanopterin hydro-lyase
LIFGPAQAAVAKAVMDSVEEGVISKDRADDLLLIVSVYVDKSAEDKTKIYEYNYEATRQAIERAIENEPDVDYVLKRKETAKHPLR